MVPRPVSAGQRAMPIGTIVSLCGVAMVQAGLAIRFALALRDYEKDPEVRKKTAEELEHLRRDMENTRRTETDLFKVAKLGVLVSGCGALILWRVRMRIHRVSDYTKRLQ
eukprot:gnl/TRDRNA2_/TRDRNA2_186628_c0_seq1.p2 gnl/TRDRNA2_/TRDRNA2_186628_c0~~gnl/TRDRNA2_/TRDRNA2_186628_c0_seq1.p2  ORF type:complete len:110 (-),score=10.75 gnl/TRDRNA2_/TRDRNA2_186628_c0_seq1:178-507(-)